MPPGRGLACRVDLEVNGEGSENGLAEAVLLALDDLDDLCTVTPYPMWDCVEERGSASRRRWRAGTKGHDLSRHWPGGSLLRLGEHSQDLQPPVTQLRPPGRAGGGQNASQNDSNLGNRSHPSRL